MRFPPSFRFAAIVGLFLAGANRLPADEAPGRQMTRADLMAAAERIEKEVARLRGWPFKHEVKKDVYTEEQLREFILKALDRELGAGKLERKQAMLTTTGVLPPGEDMRKRIIDVLLNQVGGFYDPETKSFYMLIREGVVYSPFVNDILVAHELCHALDDQYINLAKLVDPSDQTEDGAMAIAAVVEGSATILMQRYTVAALEDGGADPEELAAVAESEMKRSQAFFESPPYYSTLLANYLCGMNFFTEGDLAFIAEPGAGRAMQRKLLQAAESPPKSTEQILHPEKYWNAARRDEPLPIHDEPLVQLLERDGAKVIHTDTLGELLMALLAQPADRPMDMFQAMLPSFWTNEAATGWGGDRFFLVARGDVPREPGVRIETPRGLWVTRWDTPADREEFVEDYAYHRDTLEREVVLVGEATAVFLYGFKGEELEDLRQRLPRLLAE